MITRGLLLLLSLAAAPLQAQDAMELLQRVQDALRMQDYHGEIALARDGQLDALAVDHDARSETSRVESLTQRVPTLTRRGQTVSVRDGQAVDLGAGMDPQALALAATYRLSVVGEDRVAGRVAWVIEAQTRDAWRYARRIWVDRDSGLPLRVATRGADGGVVEQWMFTRLVLGQQQEPAGVPGPVARRFVGPVPAPSEASRYVLEGMPEGFRLIASSRAEGREHLVVADGLSKVSVFIEPIEAGNAVLSGVHRRGAMHVFGRLFDGRQLVVVGEVPAATVERLAQGLRLESDG